MSIQPNRNCFTLLTFFLFTGTLVAPAAPYFDVREFGASGNADELQTGSIQAAIDSAHAAGGGTVYFPPGKYLTGTIYLKSHVRLDLDMSAVILGSTRLEDYPLNRCEFPSYTDRYCVRALFWGEGLEDIAIAGRGTIDGQGAAFRDNIPSEEDRDKTIAGLREPSRYVPQTIYVNRPYVIRLISCRKILVEGITLRDSPMWMQHYLDCDFLEVRGITVYNHVSRNNDMIDIDCCREVIVSDCFGDTDDDALTLKSTAGRPTENVTVTNCVLSSHCNAFKAGTESSGGFKNITLSNCAIRPSKHPDVGCGRREGLAGIALEIVDGGTLDGVTISNVTMKGTSAPIFMRLGNRARPYQPDMPPPPVGTFRNVSINNIVATEAWPNGCSITGIPGHPIENVSLSNIKITFQGEGEGEHSMWEVPENEAKYPESTMFGTLPSYGFFCRHVDGLTFQNVKLGLEKTDNRPALICDDVAGLSLDGFDVQAAPGIVAPLVFRDVRDALIRGCFPSPADAFIRCEAGCEGITTVANDFRWVRVPLLEE